MPLLNRFSGEYDGRKQLGIESLSGSGGVVSENGDESSETKGGCG